MTIAYPFVTVDVDLSGLAIEAKREVGVLAIVGSTDGEGTAAANTPIEIGDLSQAAQEFAKVDADGVLETATPLYTAIKTALRQNPRASTVYGVKVNGAEWTAALSVLEGMDDVTFVCLAGMPIKTSTANSVLKKLKSHCEDQSSAGNKRIGVAHIDPTIEKSSTYVSDLEAKLAELKSDTSRMVVVAARGADDDGSPAEVAAAAASAIAGQPVASSLVLKNVVGFKITETARFTPLEIKDLSELLAIPVIDPKLITGESLHFAEGTCFTANTNLKYIDIVRLLDDLEFRIKAKLIRLVGDARVTTGGLSRVVRAIEKVLDSSRANKEIDRYEVVIPVLDALLLPEASRTPAQVSDIATARQQREVTINASVWIGPAVHRLSVKLKPEF